MAHPVAFAAIAITGIVAYTAVKITENISNNKKDEDRNVGNRNGKIRQS